MDTSKIVTVRAPLRISFAGGGTDTEIFASQYGGAVLSAAISRYATVRGGQGEPSFTAYPIDEADEKYIKKAAEKSDTSIWLESRIDAPPRSGLGASGALSVAALACVWTLNKREYHYSEIAEEAYKLEKKLGLTGGKQDQYPAVWGEINYIEFSGTEVKSSFVDYSDETLLALESSIILVFIYPRIGTSHKIMLDETRRVQDKDKDTIQALLRQRELARLGMEALKRGDLMSFGDILHEAWETKKHQSPYITSEVIDAVYSVARRAGALGGKLSGAGGGGYMFFFAPGKEGPVSEALRAIGLRPESITFDMKGLLVW